MEAWQEEMRLSQSLGDSDEAASTLYAIAQIYWARPHHPIPGLGDPHRAIAYAKQAVAMDSRKSQKAIYLNNLSAWYAMLGNLERAIQCSDLAASYDSRDDFDRERRMRYINEFAERGYIELVSIFLRLTCGLTKRAADKWDSARFLGMFLAMDWFRFEGDSTLRPDSADARR